MICPIEDEKTQSQGVVECPVFKIDFSGRFVFLDDLSERLLGLPREKLFGRSIREFLDEESYHLIRSIIRGGTSYETFFKAAELTFLDASGIPHCFGVIISLNFIAGNPANYQIIINPLPLHEDASSADDPRSSISRALFDCIGTHEAEPDLDRIVKTFLVSRDIFQVGLYRYDNGQLYLLSAVAADDYRGRETDFSQTHNRHLNVVRENRPLSNTMNVSESPANGGRDIRLIEECYPLQCRDCSWGLLRIIHRGFENADSFFESAAAFLGNTLFSFVGETPPQEISACGHEVS
jgi:hypothetical protein